MQNVDIAVNLTVDFLLTMGRIFKSEEKNTLIDTQTT